MYVIMQFYHEEIPTESVIISAIPIYISRSFSLIARYGRYVRNVKFVLFELVSTKH